MRDRREKLNEMAVLSLVIIVLFLVFHVIVFSYDECSGPCSVESK